MTALCLVDPNEPAEWLEPQHGPCSGSGFRPVADIWPFSGSRGPPTTSGNVYDTGSHWPMLAAMEQVINEHDEPVWLPTAAAAAALNISPRTLARRVAANQLPTKIDPAGRKLVGVPAEAVNGSHQQPWPDNGSQADNGSQWQPDADKTALALAGGAVRGWQTAANEVKADLARSRRLSRLMGAIVTVLVVSGGVGIWWATKTTTQAQAQHEAVVGRLDDATTRIVQLSDGLVDERKRAEAERKQGTERVAALNQQLRTSEAQAAVLAVSRDRALEDLAKALSERDALRATQTAAVVHSVIDDVLVLESEPAPGG